MDMPCLAPRSSARRQGAEEKAGRAPGLAEGLQTPGLGQGPVLRIAPVEGYEQAGFRTQC